MSNLSRVHNKAEESEPGNEVGFICEKKIKNKKHTQTKKQTISTCKCMCMDSLIYYNYTVKPVLRGPHIINYIPFCSHFIFSTAK